MSRLPIGELLIAGGILTPERAASAMRSQAASGMRLASHCLALGYAEEVDLLKALSKQKGIPGLDLSRTVVPISDLKIIPSEVARNNLVLPVRVEAERVFVAMADPDRRELLDEIQFVTGRPVVAYVALEGALRRAIEDAYALLARGAGPYYKGSRFPPDARLFEAAARMSAPAIRSGSGPVPAVHATPPPAQARGGAAGLTGAPAMALGPQSQTDAIIGEAIETTPAGLDPLQFEGIGDELSTVTQMPSPTGPTAGTGRKILVVDDDDDVRRLVCTMLRKRGHTPIEAARGLEAIKLVQQQLPDLVILDAMLPEIHGFEICRKLKATPRYRDMPILMMSAVYRGWRFARDLQESYKADGFIEKPFKMEDLLRKVDNILEGSQRIDRERLASAQEAERHYRSGVQKFISGDNQGAMELFRTAVSVDPLSAKLRYHLAATYLKSNQFYQAIQEFEEAVNLKPNFFNALKSLAMLYQRMGFKYKAIETWERAMASAPNDQVKGSIKEHIVSLF
jgi:DNA-binding response OmpR family regulator